MDYYGWKPYLSVAERQQASQLFQTLKLAEKFAAESTLTPPEIAHQMTNHLNSVGGIDGLHRLGIAATQVSQVLPDILGHGDDKQTRMGRYRAMR